MNVQQLQQRVDRLYHAGGQPVMESALAMWYLKRAAGASTPEIFNDAIHKAQTLDPKRTFLWLAESHHRKNQFDRACHNYLEAFSRSPYTRKLGTAVGEYLLRYGTPDQVVDFYSQVAARDTNNAPARFVLDCYAYFESLKQEIGTSILCASHPVQIPQRLFMQVVFWGPRYTDVLLNYLLPALCVSGNLPSIAKKFQVHFIITTDDQGSRDLQQHPFFVKLKQYCVPHIITFPNRLFDYATRVSKTSGGKWTIPATLLTNASHYAVLECGRRLESLVLNLSPDHILSDRFMIEMTSTLSRSMQALAGPGFRFYYEPTLLNEIEKKYRKPDGTLCVSPREMERLLINYLPQANFVHSDRFSAYPIYLCWPVGRQGIIAHVNHYHPWVVNGAGLNGGVPLSLDPIDGNFLDRCLQDRNAIGFAPNAMLSFDLGNNPLCIPHDDNRFAPEKVARWLRPFLTPVHEKYFRHSLAYNAGEDMDSPQWHAVALQAETIIKEIIADAKQA